MGVSFDFDIISRREGAGISFDLKPLIFFVANLTLLTFACDTNQMPTFVAANFLFSDLFSAYPATKGVIKFINFDISELFKG